VTASVRQLEKLPIRADLIDEVGPDGQFLKLPHTRRHMRERWYPILFDRDNYDGWLAKGGQTLAERAAEQVSRILASHQCEPLSPAAAEAIRRIVLRAETRPGSEPLAPASGGSYA